MAKTQTVKIKSNEENPEPLEIIAKAIIDVSEAYEKIQKSRVTERVIVLLIKDCLPNVTINDIKQVLAVVPKLKQYYLKK